MLDLRRLRGARRADRPDERSRRRPKPRARPRRRRRRHPRSSQLHPTRPRSCPPDPMSQVHRQRVPVHVRVRDRGPPGQDRRPDLRRRARRRAARRPLRPRRLRDARQHRPRRRVRRDLDRDLRRHPGRSRASTIRKIGYTDADLGFSADSCAVINAIDKQSPDIAQGVDEAYEARTDASDDDRARHRRRGRPGDDVRLRVQRDRRADAAADLARAQARAAARRRAQGRGRPLPAAGRQDAGLRALPRRQAGRDREAADLDAAPRGRRVADPGRPVGARGRADPPARPLRRAQAAQAASSSTRPAGS